jgi:hypothetical protein
MKRVIFVIAALTLCQTEAQAGTLSFTMNAVSYQRPASEVPTVMQVSEKKPPARQAAPRKSKNPWDNPWWYEPGLTAGGGVPTYVPSPYATRPMEWGTTGQNGMGLRPGPNGYEGSSYGPCMPRCM